MSIVDTLRFSDVSRKSENSTPHILMRRRLLSALDEQTQGAICEAAGKHFYRTVEKTVKNAETGVSERQRQERNLRRMYWQSGTTLMFEPKFGGKSLKLGDKGESTIAIDPAVGVGETIAVVMKSVEAGEFDAILLNAVAGRKRGGRVKKDGKPVSGGSGTAALAAATVPATVAKTAAKAGK